MTISEKIVLYRKKAGLSQEELAQKLSVSRQAVSKWETGESIPESTKLVQLSKLFGVSVDFLIDDEKETYSPPHSERKAFIDEAAADKATAFLSRHIWLSGVLLIVIGGIRLVQFIASLISLSQVPYMPFTMYIPVFAGNLVNFALIIGGIIIIVKLKPKKNP